MCTGLRCVSGVLVSGLLVSCVLVSGVLVSGALVSGVLVAGNDTKYLLLLNSKFKSQPVSRVAVRTKLVSVVIKCTANSNEVYG